MARRRKSRGDFGRTGSGTSQQFRPPKRTGSRGDFGRTGSGTSQSRPSAAPKPYVPNVPVSSPYSPPMVPVTKASARSSRRVASPVSTISRVLSGLDARVSLPDARSVRRAVGDAVDYVGRDTPVRKFDRMDVGRGARSKPDAVSVAFSMLRDLSKDRPNLKRTDRGLVVKGVGRKRVETPGGKAAKGRGKPRSVPRRRAWGEPTVGQFTRAAERGRLVKTRKGRLATKGQLKAAGRLREARGEFRRARRQAGRAGVSGPITRGQKTFIESLAKQTGLDPRVVGGWVLSEMSDGFARQREREGNHNWLNIAYFDSGPGSITKDPVWGSPRSAAKASAQFLRGERFGASPGIQAILSSAGKSPERQIQRIAGSGWASSGYNGGDSLRRTAAMIDVERRPGAVRRVREAREDLRAAASRAVKLGVPGAKMPKGGQGPSGGRSETRLVASKRKGPFAGSRRMVSKILGQPVWGDKEPGHSPTGDHDPSQPHAYAQDIGSAGGNPGEGEQGLGYDQPTVDRIVKNLRKLGADVPDLKVGDNWAGNVQGYQVQLITAVHGTGPHIHLGARWTGEDPPPGTRFGGGSSGGSGGSGGGGWSTVSYSPDGASTSSESPARVAASEEGGGGSSAPVSGGVLPQEYVDLVMGGGQGGADPLEEFLSGRSKPRRRRRS